MMTSAFVLFLCLSLLYSSANELHNCDSWFKEKSNLMVLGQNRKILMAPLHIPKGFQFLNFWGLNLGAVFR